MPDLFRLQGVVNIDTTRAKRTLIDLDVTVRRLSTGLQGVSAQSAATSRAFGSIAQAASSAGRSLSAGLTAPLLALGAAAVKSAIDIETYRRQLRVATGSAEEAERQFVRLRKLALAPGIDLQGAVQGSARLQNLGFSAAQAEKTLAALANVAARSGLGAQNLREVVVQLTQMAAAGKVIGQDLRPIMQQLPEIGKAVKQVFGTIEPKEINAKVKALGLDSQTAIKLIIQQIEKLAPVNAGAKESFENLAQEAKIALAELGTPILRTLVPIINQQLIPAVEAAGKKFASLSPDAQKAALGVAAVGLAAGPVVGVLANSVIVAQGLAKAYQAMSVSALLAATSVKTLGLAAAAMTGWAIGEWVVDKADQYQQGRNARHAAGQGRFPAGTTAYLGSGGPSSGPHGFAVNEGPNTPGYDFSKDAQYGFKVKTAEDRELDAIRKRLGGVPAGGGGKGKKADLTELQQLQKQLKDVNQEIAYLSNASSKEYAVRLKLDRAQETRAELQQLLDIKRNLFKDETTGPVARFQSLQDYTKKLREMATGPSPLATSAKEGLGEQTKAFSSLLDQIKAKLPETKELTLAQAVAENEEYETLLKLNPALAETIRLRAADADATIKQTKAADIFKDARESLLNKMDTARDATEAQRTERALAGDKYKDLTQAQRDELLSTARQVDAQKQYTDALDKAREAAERFADSVKNAVENVFERLLRGDVKGAGGALKSFGISTAASGLTSALFGNQPAFAGAGGGGNTNYASAGGGRSTGWGAFDSFTGGMSRSGGGQGGGLLGNLTNRAGGWLTKALTGGGNKATGWGSFDAFTGASKGGGLLGKLGLGGLTKSFGTGGFGKLMGALGFSNPFSAIATGAILSLPLIMKAFGKDPLRDYRNHIRGEYGVDVKSESLLGGVLQLGQSKYGANYKARQLETVRLPEAREMVFEYASAMGLKGNSRLFSAALLQDPFSKMNIQSRERGGDFNPGWLLVGERGPELMRTNRGGSVVPNEAIGGGSELAAAVMALIDKLTPMSADEVVRLARPGTVTRHVERSFRDGDEASRAVSKYVSKR